MLTEDIKIYAPFDTDAIDRISLSNGLERAPDSDYGIRFESDAYRPELPWRIPSAGEAEILMTADAHRNPSRTVGVARLPESITRTFRDIGLPQAESEEELKVIRKAHVHKYMEAMDQMYDYMKSFQSKEPETFSKIGIMINDPGKRNVTVNTKNGCMTGLHLDSWDRIDIDKLDTATNRICVNIGMQDRYFLFINLSASSLSDLVQKATTINPSTIGKNELCDLFFRHYGHWPVIKLRIKPFEAYIAPTENIIHDGCTEGNIRKDISCTVRGFFNIAGNA